MSDSMRRRAGGAASPVRATATLDDRHDVALCVEPVRPDDAGPAGVLVEVVADGVVHRLSLPCTEALHLARAIREAAEDGR